MIEPSQSAIAADVCMKASHFMHQKLIELCDEIERTNNPTTKPSNSLAVDEFLDQMQIRVNAPRIVFQPQLEGEQAWSGNLTGHIYTGIENAFVAAGNLPGEDRAGQIRKLKELLAWVEVQMRNPTRPIPEYFLQRTTYMFRRGFLDDRRKERRAAILEIAADRPASKAALQDLKAWIEEDLQDDFLRQNGRPAKYQKIMFAGAIANLWNKLTEKKITRGPNTNFAKFLQACWDSGFEGKTVDPGFKRIIREHIGEKPISKPCKKCSKCKKGANCIRNHYFGILPPALKPD